MQDEDDLLVEESNNILGNILRVAMLQLGLNISSPRLRRAPARWFSRMLHKNVCELELETSDLPQVVRDRAVSFLTDHGELVDTNASDDGTYRVRGKTRPGSRGSTRVVVTVTASLSSGGGSDVQVRGACQGGWVIKSRDGDKYARLIADALRQRVPESGGSPWPS